MKIKSFLLIVLLCISSVDALNVLVGISQSNGKGTTQYLQQLTPNLSHTPMMYKDHSWQVLQDPVNNQSTIYGSSNPIIASLLTQQFNETVNFINVAVDGSSILEWQQGTPNYNNMVNYAKEGFNNTNIDILLIDIGETNSLNGLSYDNYKSNLEQAINNTFNDLNVSHVFIILTGGNYNFGSPLQDKINNIREAQVQVCYELENVYCVYDTVNIVKDDESKLHYSSNESILNYSNTVYNRIIDVLVNNNQTEIESLYNITNITQEPITQAKISTKSNSKSSSGSKSGSKARHKVQYNNFTGTFKSNEFQNIIKLNIEINKITVNMTKEKKVTNNDFEFILNKKC